MQMGKRGFASAWLYSGDENLELIAYTGAGALFAKAEFGEAAPCLIADLTADESELNVGDDLRAGLIDTIRVPVIIMGLVHDGDAEASLGVEADVLAVQPVELEGGNEADVMMTGLAAVVLVFGAAVVVSPEVVHVAIGSGVGYVTANADNGVDVVVVFEREDGELVGVAVGVAGVGAARDEGGGCSFTDHGCEVGDAVENLGGGAVADGDTEFVMFEVLSGGLSVCIYTYSCATEDEGGCDEDVS